MSKVLDPNLLGSFLTDAEIWSRAETIAGNPGLQASLSSNSLIERFRGRPELAYLLNSQDELEHAIYHSRLFNLSQFCIVPLMQDGAGRSEYHISGEVCRLVKAIRTIGLIDKIPELVELHESPQSALYSNEFWIPEGCIYPSPTIDGQNENEMRFISWQGRLSYGESFHRAWLDTYTGKILPELSQGPDAHLSRVQVPFELATGGVVTYTEPIYYQARRDFCRVDTPTPKILISA